MSKIFVYTCIILIIKVLCFGVKSSFPIGDLRIKMWRRFPCYISVLRSFVWIFSKNVENSGKKVLMRLL